ncbi:MAG: hypothetical protein KGJ58_00810 [Patescibacteria group bacterium]|nr:hypothetical protein [Patescibacteria group bacterium]MDE1988164.1 hypothetical protein [Patescibacteria group bacterium]MDE2217984.1 hypothetical protein [Patescibacteria group bacterium]
MISLWIWVMVTYAIFACVALVLMEKEVSIDEKNKWNLGWAILSIEFFHFGLSFRTVGPKSLGAVLLFGRPLHQVKSGLVYVPFIVCQLAKETKLVIKEQFPAEPEFVDKSGLDNRPVPTGYLKPIRVTTASRDMISDEDKVRIKEFKDHPLNEIMTLEPSVVVRFQIRGDDFISFLTNIGSIEHAVSQMRDTVDSVLNIEFPKRTPALIIIDKEEINRKLREKIEILVGEIPDPEDPDSFNQEESWGINVINVQLADVDLSKTINQSLRDVADSKLRYEVGVKEAEKKKKSRELEGEGEKKFETDKGTGVANARLSFLEAEAEGLEKIAGVAKTTEGKVAIISKTQEEALKNAKYSIIPEGLGSLISSVQEILKKTKSPDDDDDKKTGGKK